MPARRPSSESPNAGGPPLCAIVLNDTNLIDGQPRPGSPGAGEPE
jgi:hypothetical protein